MSNIFFVMREPGQADHVLVWDTRTLSIGRGPDNDLVLDDDEVSRKHAVLSNEGAGMEIADYRTGNGTFVDQRRVQDKAALQPGSVIAIGKLQLELCVSEEHPAKLGHKLVYGSQLKMAGVLPDGMDGERTILGMEDTQQVDEPFVIEPERSSGSHAFVVDSGDDPGFQVRQLDAELDDLSLELDDGFDDGLGDRLALDDALELDAGLELAGPVQLPAIDPMEADPVTGEHAVLTPQRPTAAAPPRPAPAATPAAPPAAATPPAETEIDPVTRMKKLKVMHEAGLITDEEFAAKRAQILSDV